MKYLQIIRFILFLFLLILNSQCSKSSNSSTSLGSTNKKNIKVLFIGNSLTYTHDIPNTLKELAASSNEYNFEVDSLVEGGMQINYFLQGGSSSLAYQKIMSSKWNFVVLQQQSSSQEQYINRDYLVQNSDSAFYTSLVDPENTSPWCQKKRDSVLCTYERLIRTQGAEPVFYMHWIPSFSTVLGIRSGGSFIYAAQKLNAVIAPVGVSFFKLKDLGYSPICGSLECILQDEVHPGPLGAYAAATVFYATLTNSSPVGLIPLQGLSATAAQSVQRVAWDTYLSMKNSLFSFSDSYSILSGNQSTNYHFGPTSIPRCLSIAQLEEVESICANTLQDVTSALHTYMSTLSTQNSETQCYHFVE